eukprot:Sspe_Gene.99595::Locus_73271_Transcript_1_1_Confidence_1.000_Length_1214::g.99595::m.99595
MRRLRMRFSSSRCSDASSHAPCMLSSAPTAATCVIMSSSASSSVNGPVAPLALITSRQSLSRDRDCKAPAAHRLTSARGCWSRVMIRWMPRCSRMGRAALWWATMLCSAPAARATSGAESSSSIMVRRGIASDSTAALFPSLCMQTAWSAPAAAVRTRSEGACRHLVRGCTAAISMLEATRLDPRFIIVCDASSALFQSRRRVASPSDPTTALATRGWRSSRFTCLRERSRSTVRIMWTTWRWEVTSGASRHFASGTMSSGATFTKLGDRAGSRFCSTKVIAGCTARSVSPPPRHPFSRSSDRLTSSMSTTPPHSISPEMAMKYRDCYS